MASALLYNCTGDDAETLDPSNESSDTLQPGDSVFTDTVYPGGDYPVTDTIVQDSIYFPVDSISGDTIIIVPLPGEPQPPADTVESDSIFID